MCIDLYSKEVENWRRLDPSLALDVQDATELPYEDGTFEAVVSVSVLEHIGREADARALNEMWRVLKPSGVLHLTTDVAHNSRDVYLNHKIYGGTSDAGETGAYFFKHDFSVAELDQLVAQRPWKVLEREFAKQVDPGIESRFYGRRPWSYAYGPFLRFNCPNNFSMSDSADLITGEEHGVVYLRLEKPSSTAPS